MRRNSYLSYIQSVVIQRNSKFRHLPCSILSTERPSFISYLHVNFLTFVNVSNRCRTYPFIGVPLMIIIDLLIGFFVEYVTWTQSVGLYKKKWPSYKFETRRIIRIVKIGKVSQTQTVNILLLRNFIHIVYLRSNYMFRAFFSRSSSGWSYILEKNPKHVVAPKVRYVNKLLSNDIFTVCVWLTLPILTIVCSTLRMAHLKELFELYSKQDIIINNVW
jgi:hypothetical protein